MHLSIRTIVEFFAFSSALLVAFSLVGAPLKLLLSMVSRDVSEAVSTPVIGAAIVIVGSWWWYGPLGGVRPVAWISLAAALMLLAVLAIVPQTRQRLFKPPLLDARRKSGARLFAICLVGTGALFFVEQGQVFTREHMTVISLGNSDAADYAMVSQHQLDEPLENLGPVVGHDFGFRASWFPGGACAFLAAAASFSGFDVWKVMEASLFCVLFLGVYSLALLMRRLLGISDLVHGLIAVAGFGVVYMEAMVGQWFFAQLLGIVVMLTCIAVLRAALDSQRWTDYLAATAVLVLLLHAGLWIYPHMVVAGCVVLLPFAAISLESWRVFAQRALLSGAMFGVALGLTVVSAPGLAQTALDASRVLKDVEAGWPLPGLLPTELLGFQTGPASPHGLGAAITSAALLAIVLASGLFAWWRGWRRPAEALLVALAVILVSYLYVYIREGGPSYRQWKWITFFVPLFVASVLGVVIAVVDRLWEGAPSRSRVVGGLLGFIALTVYIGSPTSMGLTATNYRALTLDQITIENAPALQNVTDLHIDVPPFWETMWVSYFLRDKELTLQNPSYWAMSPPLGDVILQRNDSGPPAEGYELVAMVNETYRLVRQL